MPVHLYAQVLEACHARRRGDSPRRCAHGLLRDPAPLAVCANLELPKVWKHLCEPVGMSGQPVVRDQTLLYEHADHRGEEPGVRTRLHLQVEIGDLRGLGSPRVDYDEAAIGILRDLAQGDASAGDAVREPRVLPQNNATSQCSKSARV